MEDSNNPLLDLYYKDMQIRLDSLVENVNAATSWCLVLQCEDLNADGTGEWYNSKQIRIIKQNFFNGTRQYEDDMIDPILINNRYLPRRYFSS